MGINIGNAKPTDRFKDAEPGHHEIEITKATKVKTPKGNEGINYEARYLGGLNGTARPSIWLTAKEGNYKRIATFGVSLHDSEGNPVYPDGVADADGNVDEDKLLDVVGKRAYVLLKAPKAGKKFADCDFITKAEFDRLKARPPRSTKVPAGVSTEAPADDIEVPAPPTPADNGAAVDLDDVMG